MNKGVYLPGGPDVGVDDVVEVLVDSVQQPQEELLRVVLGVALELQGALGHHVLQRDKHNAARWTAGRTQTGGLVMKYSARPTGMLISAIRKVSGDAARRAEKLLKTPEADNRRLEVTDSEVKSLETTAGRESPLRLIQGQDMRGQRPGRLPVSRDAP
ncbi:hypothetical protein EYF80_040689 [Liparis tanakae]|uniref:Uncharacterized protein n=1 Tax=Liparis tanakae TaxID=230148 RepID=A0A4Z2G8F4_9TELE|nr:hypothetical protein EYF80_040689 [Liparis tanakae]